jgi:hypothetical protein
VRTTHTGRRDEGLVHEAESGADVAREIEGVVALLRSLPDPEPEADLTARVMRKVAEIEARPRVVRLFYGHAPGSGAAAALAAGIACAVVGLGLQATRGPVSTPEPASVATAATDVGGVRAADVSPVSEQVNRLAMLSAMGDPRTAALFSGSTANASLGPFPVIAEPASNLLDRRLDALLNELQLDPQAFFRRLERIQEPDRYVQRLAERAARRGDAAQVALNVRAASHPLARPMVDQLLHASLVRQVSGR